MMGIFISFYLWWVKSMLLGLFKNVIGCVSDPSKIVHSWRIQQRCNNIFGECRTFLRVDLNIKFSKSDHTHMKNGEASHSSSWLCKYGLKEWESLIPEEKVGASVNDSYCIETKKGRLKQKKLSLNVCSFRDQPSPKEDLKSNSSSSFDENISKGTTRNNPIFPLKRPMWKCQASKAPTCVEQHKVMQS